MSIPEWSEIDGTYVCDGYSIERGVARDWLLLLDAPRTTALAPRRFLGQQTYASLPLAGAVALHLEVVMVRRVELIRHIATAVVMLALAVSFYVVMVSGTSANQLKRFALSAAVLVIALSESLDGFALLVADGWDHRYEAPGVAMVDKIVSGFVLAVLWPQPRTAPASDAIVNVRPLT